MPTDLTGTPTSLGIGTFNTSADAPSGLGFNAAMAQIDALLVARVTKPAGVAAGDVPVWNGTTWVVPSGTRDGTKFLRDDGAWVVTSGAPTGAVIPFASSTPPTGWLLADGSEVSRSTYAALDSVIGTTYGAYTNGSGGAGTTHLRLPDLRGRMVAGFASGGHSDVSALGNNEGVALAARRPKHKHTKNGTVTRTGGVGGGSWDAFNPGSGTGSTGTGGGDRALQNYSVSDGLGISDTISIGPQTGNEPTDATAYIVLAHIIKT